MHLRTQLLSNTTERLRVTVLWFWMSCFIAAALVFVLAFWGALLLPDQLYLFMAEHIAQINIVTMAVLSLGMYFLAPPVSEGNEAAFRVASLMNAGWLLFSISLGPYFLHRYHYLPPSDFREFYYHSYLASYVATSLACVISNGLMLLTSWRRKAATKAR